MSQENEILSVAFCIRAKNYLIPLAECALSALCASSLKLTFLRDTLPSTDTLCEIIKNNETCTETKQSHISLEQHTLYYSIVDGFVYYCVTTPTLESQHAQEFLENVQRVISESEVKKTLLKNCVQSQPLNYYHLLYDFLFAKLYNLTMDTNKKFHFNANGGAVSASGLQSTQPHRMADLQRQVMSQNVIRVMERGEQLTNLDTRTEALHASSQNFRTTARRVQRDMCLKNLKWTIVLIAFICILALLIIGSILKELGVFDKK